MKLIGPDGGDGLRAYLRAIGSTRDASVCWTAGSTNWRHTARHLNGFAKYWEQLHELPRGDVRSFRTYDAMLSPVCATPAVTARYVD